MHVIIATAIATMRLRKPIFNMDESMPYLRIRHPIIKRAMIITRLYGGRKRRFVHESTYSFIKASS
jgi:hypothetical protein